MSRGLGTAAGVLVANALYFMVSATGVFAILLAGYAWFFAIKWLGAVYLVWIGIQTWRHAGADPRIPGADTTAAAVRWHSFGRGLVVQLSNPKSILFFGALLPQFVDASQPVAGQIVILGLTSMVVEFAVLSGYSFAASRAGRLRQRPGFRRWVGRTSGALLVGAGAGLAALRR